MQLRVVVRRDCQYLHRVSKLHLGTAQHRSSAEKQGPDLWKV
jgi:hypothetical protein